MERIEALIVYLISETDKVTSIRFERGMYILPRVLLNILFQAMDDECFSASPHIVWRLSKENALYTILSLLHFEPNTGQSSFF